MSRCGTRHRTLVVALLVAALAALVPALAGCGADPDEVAAASPADQVLDLRSAPWADQPHGSPLIGSAPEWPSLRFAPGITYAGALHRLYVAARTGAPTVEDAETAPALPREVVYVAPGTGADGLRLSLLAPWGWVAPDGAIRPPSISMPSDLSHDEIWDRVRAADAQGLGMPEGGRVDVPQLPRCQVATGTPDERPPC
jgi:hypothetical protein